jgi:hypothetical protein
LRRKLHQPQSPRPDIERLSGRRQGNYFQIGIDVVEGT